MELTTSHERTRSLVAPTPAVVAVLWAEVLGLSEVGADDDLAGLGADSLQMTRVVARLKQVCGIKVPFRVVFEARTPTALAAALHDLRPPAEPEKVIGARAAAGHRTWPLSHDQRRLWLLD